VGARGPHFVGLGGNGELTGPWWGLGAVGSVRGVRGVRSKY